MDVWLPTGSLMAAGGRRAAALVWEGLVVLTVAERGWIGSISFDDGRCVAFVGVKPPNDIAGIDTHEASVSEDHELDPRSWREGRRELPLGSRDAVVRRGPDRVGDVEEDRHHTLARDETGASERGYGPSSLIAAVSSCCV